MAKDLTLNRNAQQDNQQVFSTLGVQGTAGTADTSGTAPTIPFSADPVTGAQYVYNLGPAGAVSASGTNPAVSLPVRLTDGTSFYNASGGAGGGTSVQVVAGTINAGTVTGLSTEYTGSAVAGTTDIIASTDVSNYRWFSLQVTNTWVGTINVQESNDNVNFISAPIQNQANTGGAFVSNITANAIYMAPIRSRYLRVRMNNFTSGTASGYLELNSLPSGLNGYGVSAGQSGAWNVTGTVNAGSVAVTAGTITSGSIAVTAGTVNSGTINAGTINAGTINLGTVTGDIASGATDSGNPVKVGGKFNTTSPAVTDGQRSDLQVDSRGNLKVVVYNSTSVQGFLADNADAVATTSTANRLAIVNRNTVFNGASWDRMGGTTTGLYAISQPYPVSQVQPAFAIGTAAIGTLVSAVGAGTGIYINSVTLTAMSGTLDMCLSFALGSTTNQVVQRGLFSPGGGVTLAFPHPSYYGTANAALTYQILGGAGTASWQVTYNSKGTP